jgi:hypothetical protein
VVAVVGAALAGARGVAVGFAVTSPMLSVLWFLAVRHARRLNRGTADAARQAPEGSSPQGRP